MEPVTFTVDGTALYAEYHAPGGRKAQGAVLVVHGFNSSMQEYGSFPERLAARGFHVLAFDQRGFGASGGEHGVTSLGRAIEDIGGAREQLIKRAGHKVRLGIVGHSLGAAMAVGYMARRDGFDAAVLAHPLDRLWDELRLVERPMMHVVGRWMRRRARKGKSTARFPYRVKYRHLFEDKARARAAKQHDSYLSRSMNLGNYDFARTMHASDWAARVTVPVLAISSPNDRVVKQSHSRPVFEALAGPVQHVEHVGGHSCFRDVDEDLLLDACDGWLRERLGGRP